MTAFFYTSYVVLWLLVVALVAGMFGLYHHFGEMYVSSPKGRQEQGQPPGDMIRSLDASALDGRPVLLPADDPTVLLFLSTTCNTCKTVRDDLPQAAMRNPGVRFVILCMGRRESVAAWAEPLPPTVTVVVDARGKLSQRFNVDLTPFAMSAGADGYVRSAGIVNGLDGLTDVASDAQLTDFDFDGAGPEHDHSDEQSHDHTHEHTHDHSHVKEPSS